MIESPESRVIWASILMGLSCLAYFYMLDHVLFTSASFSPIFRLLLKTYDSQAAWLAAAVCVLAAAWKRPTLISTVVEKLSSRPGSVALGTAVAISLGAMLIYREYPLSMDEYSAVFQAKIFASGQLFAQLPAHAIDWLVVRGFNGEFLIASPISGRTIEAYWPGFALVLAPFEFLRIPWLCNSMLAGLATWLIYRITKEITQDRSAPGWALLFTLASAAFIAEAISFYSMQAHLTADLLFVLLLLRPTRYRALAAGLVGSLALNLHNPLPHTLFAAPWIFSLGLDRRQRRYLPFLVLGYLPGLMLGVGWLVLRANIGAANLGASGLRSIAASVFTWPGSTLINMRAAALVKMLLWAPPGLFLLAAWGCWSCRENRHVRLLTQSALLTFVGYLFVRFDQGHGWGYRYFHSAWGTIPILAACAMTDGSQRQPRLAAFAGAAAVLSLVLLVPLQMGQIEHFITRHLAQIPKPIDPGNNIFFIHPRGGLYVADMVQIDPQLRDRNLMLVSRGAQLDAELVRENWPNAVKVAESPAAEQWYLGSADQRVAIGGSNRKQFVFRQIPALPSAAGR